MGTVEETLVLVLAGHMLSAGICGCGRSWGDHGAWQFHLAEELIQAMIYPNDLNLR